MISRSGRTIALWLGLLMALGSAIPVAQGSAGAGTDGQAPVMVDGWQWGNPLPQGDDLMAVAIGAGRLVAVGGRGAVATSMDGENWTFPARVTSATLGGVIYADGRFVAVGTDRTVITSVDGSTWHLTHHQETPEYPGDLSHVAYGNGRYVATGHQLVGTSEDLTHWRWQKPGYLQPGGIAFGAGVFVGAGPKGLGFSEDGDHWTFPDTNPAAKLVAYGDAGFVAVGGGKVVISTDGRSWEPTELDHIYYPDGLIYTNGRYLFFNFDGQDLMYKSTNGRKWDIDYWVPRERRALAAFAGRTVVIGGSGLLASRPDANRLDETVHSQRQVTLSGLSFGNGIFIAGSQRGLLLSRDGSNWWQQRLAGGYVGRGEVSGVGYADGRLLAWESGSPSTTLWTSTDGESWQLVPLSHRPVYGQGQAVTYGAGRFVIITRSNNGQHVIIAGDGLGWRLADAPQTPELRATTYGGGRFVAVGMRGVIVTSTDGAVWREVVTGRTDDLEVIAYGDGRYVAAGPKGVLTSADGQAWRSSQLPRYTRLRNLVHDGRQFVALANNSILSSPDGEHWQPLLGNLPKSEFMAAGNGLIVVGGKGGALAAHAGPGQPAAGPVCAGTFADVSAALPGCAAIQRLSARGIASGGQEGTFAPQRPVSRAELAKLLVGAMGNTPDPSQPSPFTDTRGHWAERLGYLQAALAMRAFTGFPDSTFRPDQPVTRAQLLRIAAAAIRSPKYGKYAYRDVGADQWYAAWVALAQGADLVGVTAAHPLYTGNSLQPDAPATRAEAASIIANLLEWREFDRLQSTGGASVGETNDFAIEWLYPSTPSTKLNGLAFGNGTFVAVGRFGTIMTSADGLAWTVQQTGGEDWSAVTYGGGRFVAVGARGTAGISADGVRWDRHDADTAARLNAVAYGSGVYAAVGDDGVILVSRDGTAWTPHTAGITNDLKSIAFAGGQFVAVGGNLAVTSANGAAWATHAMAGYADLDRVAFIGDHFLARGRHDWYRSADGIHWEPAGQTENAAVAGSGAAPATGGTGMVAIGQPDWPVQVARLSLIAPAAYGNDRLVRVDMLGCTSVTMDGQYWQRQCSSVGADITAISAGGSRIVTGGGPNGSGMISPDGVAWQDSDSDQPLSALAYGAGRFTGVGPGGAAATSVDGRTWLTAPSGIRSDLYGITFGQQQWVAVGANGTTLVSGDGAAWKLTSSGVTVALRGIGFGQPQSGDRFVAVGDAGTILTSPSGEQWNSQPAPGSGRLNGVAFGTAGFVAVGDAGTILHSPDGRDWQRAESGSNSPLHAVTFGAGQYVAVGNAGNVLTSFDGRRWEPQPTGTAADLAAVVYTGGQFVAGGPQWTVLTSSDGRTWRDWSGEKRPDIRAILPVADRIMAVSLGGSILVTDRSTSPLGHATAVFQPWRLGRVAASDTGFVAVDVDGRLLHSPNGEHWTVQRPDASAKSGPDGAGDFERFSAGAYGNGQFLALGNQLYSAPDGTHWQTVPDSAAFQFHSILFRNGHFEGRSNRNDWTSIDGRTWTKLSRTDQNPMVIAGNGLQLQVGRDIRVSRDGASWTETGIRLDVRHLAFGGGWFVGITWGDRIVASHDGRVWYRVRGVPPVRFSDLVYTGGRFIAMGDGGAVMSLQPLAAGR